MNKDTFFSYCSSATYGQSEDGYMSMRVEVRQEPTAHISGPYGVYLTAHFRGNHYRTLYSPHQKYGPTQEGFERCKRALPKYEKWLAEWMADNPPATSIELCEYCNGPAVINELDVPCWCKVPLADDGDGSQMAPSDEEISQKHNPR